MIFFEWAVSAVLYILPIHNETLEIVTLWNDIYQTKTCGLFWQLRSIYYTLLLTHPLCFEEYKSVKTIEEYRNNYRWGAKCWPIFNYTDTIILINYTTHILNFKGTLFYCQTISLLWKMLQTQSLALILIFVNFC